MKPVFAKRLTKCEFCKDDILAGTRRYDDVIKAKTFYRRIHYHAEVLDDQGEVLQKDCYASKTEAWFEKHKADIVITTNNGGGHPISDLSDDQRKERSTILVRLANVTRYYQDKLALQTSPDQLTSQQLRQFNNFAVRFQECKEQLMLLGGIPPRYLNIGIAPSVTEEIESSVTEVRKSS